MKDLIIKTASCIAALVGLLMLVGDMPEASIVATVTAKIAGAAILWGAVRIMERYIPKEEV